jgi:hypothetical protein
LIVGAIYQSIEMLASEHYTRLTQSDFGYATDILSDEIKASVFISLPPKNMKGRWLESHVNVIFIDNN